MAPRGYFFLAVFFRVAHDGLSERRNTGSLAVASFSNICKKNSVISFPTSNFN